MFVGCAPAILRPLSVLSALRPQDVFATSLYTGTGANRTVSNGLDLAGSGGLVWTKARSGGSNTLWDATRGAAKALVSDGTAAEAASGANGLQSFLSNGFTLGPSWNGENANGTSSVAWSFRRAPKFFDIVTYTGDGTSGRVIPHGLGIKPGMMIAKTRNGASDWIVSHRSIAQDQFLLLNKTDGASGTQNLFFPAPTDTTFTVNPGLNQSGVTYVVYLFAHDPDTTNGIVQCGIGGATLPWPPQWILYKPAGGAGSWRIVDSVRGFPSGASGPVLLPNTSDGETTTTSISVSGNSFTFAGLTDPVWCAIRAPIT